MNIQTIRCFIISLILLMILISPTIAKACDIKARMIAAQQQAQQRRLNETNARLQWLQLLNDLQRGCVENFPAHPTQWLANSAVFTTAFNKIKQSFCHALAAKARKTSEKNLYLSTAGATAQQIDQINRQAIPYPDANFNANANSLNSLIKQYPSPNPNPNPKATNLQKREPSAGITDIIKRLFQ